jgi:release factor glutamine methyltransferase
MNQKVAGKVPGRPPAPAPESSDLPTLAEWLTRATRFLADAGFEQAREESRLLARSLPGFEPAEFWTRPARQLTAEETDVLDQLLAARAGGVPVQYLTHQAAFRHLVLQVGPGVFVPRPETEGLVELVLASLGSAAAAEPRLLDLGLGSGAILASVLSEYPTARGVGVEASRLALDYARVNLEGAGVAGRSRLFEGDLFAALPAGEFEASFHVIVSNPPYIPESAWESLPRDVRDFEPRLALLGGTDGLDVIRRIVRGAPRFLVEGGLLALEVDESHGAVLQGLLQQSGDYVDVEVKNDLAGRQRYCLAMTRRRSFSIRDGGRLSER